MLRWLTRGLESKVHAVVLLGVRNLEIGRGRRMAGLKIELPGGESGVDKVR